MSSPFRGKPRRPRSDHPVLDASLAKTEKRCRTCGEIKPLTSMFWPRDRNQPDGFQGWCKACKQARQRAEYDYDANRDRWLKMKYGINLEDYNRMFEAQGGRCAICQNEEWCNPSHPVRARDGKRRSSQRVLHVDHDHETGQVRALLCNRCNRGIGAFEDDPERLVVAQKYLLEWNKKRVQAKDVG